MESEQEEIIGIEFHKSPSFGVAPVFRVRFFCNKKSEFVGISNTKIDGSYETDLSSEMFQKLIGIINLGAFLKLNTKYISGATCGGVEVIKVHLKSGDTVIVEDYGNSGPASLKRLKEQLAAQIYKPNWVKIS